MKPIVFVQFEHKWRLTLYSKHDVSDPYLYVYSYLKKVLSRYTKICVEYFGTKNTVNKFWVIENTVRAKYRSINIGVLCNRRGHSSVIRFNIPDCRGPTVYLRFRLIGVLWRDERTDPLTVSKYRQHYFICEMTNFFLYVNIRCVKINRFPF